MSDAAIQQMADKTWSRRDRWSHFADYVKLAAAYHPDRGGLSSALRAYIQQNALQPYMDTSDPRRWAMLALAADHQDLIHVHLPRAESESMFVVPFIANFKPLLEPDPGISRTNCAIRYGRVSSSTVDRSLRAAIVTR